MAEAKGKTNSSRKKNSSNKIKEPEKNNEQMLEIILLIILAFSVFLFLANFGICGKVGNAVAGFFFGMIGFVEYIFPFYLLVSSTFIVSNLKNKKVRNTVIYVSVVLVVISMVAQMIYTTDYLSVKQLYTDGYEEHAGGGIICGGIFFIFRNSIGIVGVSLVMIAVTVIMFVLITGISLIDVFKNFVNSFYIDDDDEEKTSGKHDTKKARAEKNTKKSKNVNKNNKVKLENLKVYEDSNNAGRQRDFFDNDDDIHEINISDEDVSQYNKKSKKAQKIVMHDEKEDFFEAEFDDGEDVLAGAVNGNEHPEVVSVVPDDYDPLMDSAFGSVTGKTGTKANTTKKETKPDSTGKSKEKVYKEGAKYRLPDINLLSKPAKSNNSNREAHVRATAIKLKNTLENFGVNVTITNYSCGPAVTRFEMQPEQGVKVSKILSLADDIKLNLAAADIRIEAPIPGKAAIGIEVPNKETSVVPFREMVESENFNNMKSKTAFAVGKDISGQVIVTDIAKMPHLLIAGATGSGKSVCINTLIMSILYKATPEEVKLIMIDPKMVELACYNGIPHLLIPVVTDPKKASGALNWAVEEMTRRYQTFADHGVRNIQGYNEKVEMVLASGDVNEDNLKKMPTIVVIVDELADLMMVAHGEVEDAIVRLSQLARAAGIHLVIATQRPSVDVITGLIKANVPSRIAFAVSSGVDSRTILDMVGAEKLLGKGDMLFYPTGYPKPVRVQGALVSDDEVSKVVEFVKKQNGVSTYDEDISKSITQSGVGISGGSGGGTDRDDYFVEAGRFIIDKEKASIGMLQRTFKIGFNRAARIMDQLAAAGVVGPEVGTKARDILMTQEQFDEYIDSNM